MASRSGAIGIVEPIGFVSFDGSISSHILKQVAFALHTASQASQSLDVLSFRALLSSVILLDMKDVCVRFVYMEE